MQIKKKQQLKNAQTKIMNYLNRLPNRVKISLSSNTLVMTLAILLVLGIL